jgi:hypothetical protein
VERLSFGTDLKRMRTSQVKDQGIREGLYLQAGTERSQGAERTLNPRAGNDVFAVGVLLGYGSRDELVAAEPDQLYERPIMFPETLAPAFALLIGG